MGEPANVREWLREHPGVTSYEPWTIARVAAAVAHGEHFWFLLPEFLDEVPRTSDVEGLIIQRPVDLTDARLHAFLGALAEHLAAAHGVQRPAWAVERSRFLEQWWFPTPERAFDALAIRESPAAFRRRGIFIGASLLSRC